MINPVYIFGFYGLVDVLAIGLLSSVYFWFANPKYLDGHQGALRFFASSPDLKNFPIISGEASALKSCPKKQPRQKFNFFC